jgi:hypothetical protein
LLFGLAGLIAANSPLLLVALNRVNAAPASRAAPVLATSSVPPIVSVPMPVTESLLGPERSTSTLVVLPPLSARGATHGIEEAGDIEQGWMFLG